MKPRRSDGLIVLLEAADVHHPSPIIKRCKRWSRSSLQLQFTQVIVLDDPSAASASPSDQRKPPRQRHRHPERRLLARRHNCEFRCGGALDTGGNIHSFRIDGDSCHKHAGQAERSSSERKAWYLSIQAPIPPS